jgi:hypothetical protein
LPCFLALKSYTYSSKEEEEGVRKMHLETIAAMHGGTRFQRTASTQMDVKKQADLSMVTPFALQKRVEHKRNPKVKGALQRWWESLGHFATGYNENEAGEQVLRKEQWGTLCVALVCKLDPDVDEAEAAEAAEDEWEDDKNKDKDFMDFEHFYEAMYTLTDTWVDDLGKCTGFMICIPSINLICRRYY